jgi:hypothetical protein
MSLTMYDYTDRDLLVAVSELADDSGWTSIDDVAQRVFGIRENASNASAVHARRCIGIRFAWMARYGFLQHSPKGRGLWRPTRAGDRLRAGALRAAQRNAVEGAADDQLMELAAAIGDRYIAANEVAATAMRRSWAFYDRQKARAVKGCSQGSRSVSSFSSSTSRPGSLKRAEINAGRPKTTRSRHPSVCQTGHTARVNLCRQ